MSVTIRSALLATLLSSPAFAAFGELSEQSLPKVAPIAEQAGLGPGASLLEDEAFALVDPESFAALRELRAPESLLENRTLAASRARVESLLEGQGIDGAVTGRIKSLYSLHAKMERKGLELDQVLDRVALRVVVEGESAAYEVLSALRTLPVIADSEDDYIQFPKPSGYEALHLAIVEPSTKQPVEVQVRTVSAHESAENGKAAHWRYKLA